jgi:hypothetical protein
MAMDSKRPSMSAGKSALRSKGIGEASTLLLTWGLIRWTARELPCSHSDAVVLAAAQVGGLFIRSVADWTFR